MTPQYYFLVALWIVYFLLHSLLAANSIKSRFTIKIGDQGYRIFYVAISIVGLLVILIYMATIDSPYLFQRSNAIKYLSYSITTVGVVVIHQAFKQFSAREFLGFKSEGNVQDLKVEGILKYTRHPIYLGTVIITIGFFLFSPRLTVAVSNACIYIYLIVGIHLEEKKLESQYGASYRKYKEKVPVLFPRLKFW